MFTVVGMHAVVVGYAKSVVSKEECLKEETKEIMEQEARGSWGARMQRSRCGAPGLSNINDEH
jgi:hypothetical protein